MFEGAKQEIYRELKLEGIREAPINLCITCDRYCAGPVVLGRTHIKAMDIYSTVWCSAKPVAGSARRGPGRRLGQHLPSSCAARNAGLAAARVPVAYLCLGYVSHFYQRPELEASGWRQRLPLEELKH